MLNASQSLLPPDQYRLGIKSTVLLYSPSYDYDCSPKTLRLRSQLKQRLLYDSQLETVTNITFVTQL